MHLQVRARSSLRRTCPYCHEALRDPDTAPPCDGCGTVLHSACAAEVGCATLGCVRTPCADLKNPGAPWRATAEAEAEAAAARSYERWQAANATRQERFDAVRNQLTAVHPDPDGLGAFRPRVTHLLVALGLALAAVSAYRLVTSIGA